MKMQIHCGQTAHGQDVELHGEMRCGKIMFTLIKQPQGQRDQLDAVRDMTPETLEGLLRAVVKMREVMK